MSDVYHRQVNQEQKSQGSPAHPAHRKWNRRAKYGLALAVVIGLMTLRKTSSIAAVLLLPIQWASLYGFCSAILLVWRLLTRNPSGKPLWNRVATVSVCVGLFSAVFTVLLTFSLSAKASAESLPMPSLIPIFLYALLLVTCLCYGIGSGVRYISRRRTN